MRQKLMIGKRLREARKAANMTQGELSIKAGLDDGSNSKISHYETERYQPHYKTVCLLANILDVPECYFYCRDESMAENILAIHKKNKRYHLSPTEINELERAEKQLEEATNTVKKLLSLRLDIEAADLLPGSLKP
ncbi:helix-turn-helix domain-containing protein [Klebsiella pneumoniae]